MWLCLLLSSLFCLPAAIDQSRLYYTSGAPEEGEEGVGEGSLAGTGAALSPGGSTGSTGAGGIADDVDVGVGVGDDVGTGEPDE